MTLPNHVRFSHGSTRFSDEFGGVHSITPISLNGNGHEPHVQVRFTYGLMLDFAPATFADLLKHGPAALAKLPAVPACDDAVGGGD